MLSQRIWRRFAVAALTTVAGLGAGASVATQHASALPPCTLQWCTNTPHPCDFPNPLPSCTARVYLPRSSAHMA